MLKALMLTCGDKNLSQSVHEGAIVFLIAVEDIVALLNEGVKNSEKMPVCGIIFVLSHKWGWVLPLHPQTASPQVLTPAGSSVCRNTNCTVRERVRLLI